MRKIVADVNVEGHVIALLEILERSDWLYYLQALDVRLMTFADLGLAPNSPDDDVWHTIQRHEVIMITDNRNSNSVNSLQVTIDNHNTLSSLPVITISDVQRFKRDSDFALKAAEQLMEYLADLEDYRGTGRLYIP